MNRRRCLEDVGAVSVGWGPKDSEASGLAFCVAPRRPIVRPAGPEKTAWGPYSRPELGRILGGRCDVCTTQGNHFQHEGRFVNLVNASWIEVLLTKPFIPV